MWLKQNHARVNLNTVFSYVVEAVKPQSGSKGRWGIRFIGYTTKIYANFVFETEKDVLNYAKKLDKLLNVKEINSEEAE